MSGVNWQKNLKHCSICGSVVPPSMQKRWTPLATVFVEKKNLKKNFGAVLDPLELLHERNFWYLEKNGILKFFERERNPGPVIHGQSEGWKKNFWLVRTFIGAGTVYVIITKKILSMYS